MIIFGTENYAVQNIKRVDIYDDELRFSFSSG